MAGELKRVGETGIEVTLEFPDAEARQDFEVAFRGWAKQYQQSATAHRFVEALVRDEISGGEDTGGHLFSITKKVIEKGSWGEPDREKEDVVFYLDLLPGV